MAVLDSRPAARTTTARRGPAARGFGARHGDLAVILGLRIDRPIPVPLVAVRPGRVPALGSGDTLVLAEGALLRRTSIGPRTAGELLGPGDVLSAGAGEPAPFAVELRALTRVSLAVVDPRRAVFADPRLGTAFLAALDRAQQERSVQHVLTQSTRLEERMALAVPPIVDRWGVVTQDGIVLPAFLSHTVWAALLGVRRPSFTTAAARLADDGVLCRLEDGRWRLGVSPDELG